MTAYLVNVLHVYFITHIGVFLALNVFAKLREQNWAAVATSKHGGRMHNCFHELSSRSVAPSSANGILNFETHLAEMSF